MHVVWLRPDGFHGASPDDYQAIQLGGAGKLWLHKKDMNGYPFRVSGGWEDEDASRKLNNLVNLISSDNAKWEEHLRSSYSHSMGDDPKKFFEGVITWIEGLADHLKGDSWEIDILGQAISDVKAKLQSVKSSFLSSYN